MFLVRYIDGGPPAGEPDMSSSIWRRYSEFELLRNYLVANFPAVRKQRKLISIATDVGSTWLLWNSMLFSI